MVDGAGDMTISIMVDGAAEDIAIDRSVCIMVDGAEGMTDETSLSISGTGDIAISATDSIMGSGAGAGEGARDIASISNVDSEMSPTAIIIESSSDMATPTTGSSVIASGL